MRPRRPGLRPVSNGIDKLFPRRLQVIEQVAINPLFRIE